MNAEQLQIPVAEMEVPNAAEQTEYTIAPDGTVVKAEDIKENPEAFQDAIE